MILIILSIVGCVTVPDFEVGKVSIILEPVHTAEISRAQ